MSYGLVFGALLAMLLFSGFIGGLVWWVRRPVSARRQAGGALPLFGHDRAVVYARAGDEDDEDDDADARAQSIMARKPYQAAAGNGAATSTSSPGISGVGQDTGRAASRGTRSTSPSWSAPAPRTGYASMAESSSSATLSPAVSMPAAKQYQGRSVAYSVPTDRTLQFLLGHLEIVGGPDSGREIRFVRTPGRDPVDVTFGRNEGPPYRHVQLHDATVSRAHARLRFRDGRWSLSNLSATNPVRRNGLIVDGDVELPLAEGDRIEMGKVVFRFHI